MFWKIIFINLYIHRVINKKSLWLLGQLNCDHSFTTLSKSRPNWIWLIRSMFCYWIHIGPAYIHEVNVMAPNWVVNSKYIFVLNLDISMHSIAIDWNFQDMKFLSNEKLVEINRKPNRLYVGRSDSYSSSVLDLSHFRKTFKANYPPTSKKSGCCRHFFPFYYFYWHA